LEETSVKKCLSILLVLCMLLPLPVSAASEMGKLEEYAVQLIQYYLHHGKKAGDVVWDITRQMKETDPKQGAAWEKIMFDWSWINSDMTVYEDVIPDGLPEDDSLCIVIMGFGLNADGSIRPELADRLNIALNFAGKYPNAYLLVLHYDEYCEGAITTELQRCVKSHKLRSKTLTRAGAEMTYEIRLNERHEVVTRMLDIEGVHDATLVACQSEVGA
jgi:hypothetical protein